MKKTLLIGTVAALIAVSSYGQGFINFQGYVHGVGNNYTTPGTVTYSTGIDVQLLFAPASTSTAVSSIAASSGTAVYNVATAWSSILNDENFAAVNGPSSSATAIASTTATGGFTYNSSAAYSVANLAAGTTYTFYEVAWYTGSSGQYTTMSAAAAAGMYVGWSKSFQYTATVSASPPPATMNSSLVPAFDVGGVVVTPEPSTMALAAIGGASLLLFRRRK